MARPYTEQQVLKKLDIPDFRHLTKEKVIAFATMVPKMNPEVAKKALEQFPNFASTSLDILKEYRGVIQEAMEDDRESMRSCYDMYNRVMDSLEKMLDDNDLTFEQKTYILDQMQEVATAVADKDSEKIEEPFETHRNYRRGGCCHCRGFGFESWRQHRTERKQRH